jgi:UDP-N-acetyl-D-mannosaminuronic acid transferase (WecB/TagA/CpsF family)
MKSFSTQSFFQLGFFSEKKERLFHLLQEHLQQKTSLLTIATPNPEQIVLSQENAEFSHHLQQFDVLLPDGQGLIWASRILGQPIQQRIPGVEVVEWLLENTKETVLIVGGKRYDQFSPLSSGQAISIFNFSNSIY